jgi:hypothetical protein
MMRINFRATRWGLTLIVLLLAILSTVSVGYSNEENTDNDWDEDGISDADELLIATKYAPLLIFDEGEDEDVLTTLIPLYQVTPIIHHSGTSGAILTFVFLYDNDYGADFDRDWTDWFTDPIDTSAGLILDPFDQFFGKHCGDTEAIYFYIRNNRSWNDTWLESIYWKRHHDPFYETGQEVVAYDDFGTGGDRTHPVIFVSADKHAMYPDADSCEDYETDVVQVTDEDWIKDNITIGPLDSLVYIPTTPKMENCGKYGNGESDGGVVMQISYLPQQWNVGEGGKDYTMNHAALNGTYFEGYDPWLNQDFWGRTDITKNCEKPGGGLGRKWCGNPYAVSSGHPCAGEDWFSSSSGYCMNENTDRYGYDYYRQLMNTWDASECAQLCIKDDRCVSYSFVLPGFQDAQGICYLKEAAPAEYYNECCISGLKSDCVN